jgi:hypothetical protein
MSNDNDAQSAALNMWHSSLAARLHSDSGAGQCRLDRAVDLRACDAALTALRSE